MPAGRADAGLSEQKGSKVQVQVQLRARHAVGCLCRQLGATTRGMQGLHVGAHQSQGGGRKRFGARSRPNETLKLGPGPKTVCGGRGCHKERRRPAQCPAPTRTEQRPRVGEAKGSTLAAAAAQ